MLVLSRYEIARILGARSLQLSEGEEPKVLVRDERLKCDLLYVAALELSGRKLDVCVERKGELIHVSSMRFPSELNTLLATKDGGFRFDSEEKFHSSSDTSSRSTLSV